MNRRTATKLRPVLKGLRTVPGLVEAIARLDGRKNGDLRGNVGLVEACRRVAARDVRAGSEATFVSVRVGRGCVGHRPLDDATVVLVCRTVRDGGALDCVVEGPFVPRVARKEGFRVESRRRPFHPDPETDTAIAADLSRLTDDWRFRYVHGGTDDPWSFAVVAPQAAPVRGIEALVLFLHRDGRHSTRLVRPYNPPGKERSALCLILADAWAAPPSYAGEARVAHYPDVDSCAVTSELLHAKSFEMVLGDGDDPRADVKEATLEDWDDPRAGSEKKATKWSSVHFVARHRLETMRRAAMSHLFKALPPHVQAHASLSRRGLWSLDDAHAFLDGHLSWTPQDHVRATQCLRLLPWFRALPKDHRAWLAVREGRALPEVVGHALELGGPAHRKTTRSLTGAFWREATSSSFRIVDVRALGRALEATFARNPHVPPLTRDETTGFAKEAERFARIDSEAVRSRLVDALRLHRMLGGRHALARNEAFDAFHWIARTAIDLMSTGVRTSRHGDVVETAYALAMESVYGGASTKKASRLIERWQRTVRRAANERVAFFAAVAMRDMGPRPDLYPHFLDAVAKVGTVEFRPVLDDATLAAEGEAMSHCVGSYVHRASCGQAMIVSVSSPNGRSTAEVAFVPASRDRGAHLAVRQHRAFGNSEPTKGHVKALAELLRRTPSGGWTLLSDSIDSASRHAKWHAGERALGPGDRRAYSAMAYEWLRPFLPADGLDFDAWLARHVPPPAEEAMAA